MVLHACLQLQLMSPCTPQPLPVEGHLVRITYNPLLLRELAQYIKHVVAGRGISTCLCSALWSRSAGLASCVRCKATASMHTAGPNMPSLPTEPYTAAKTIEGMRLWIIPGWGSVLEPLEGLHMAPPPFREVTV